MLALTTQGRRTAARAVRRAASAGGGASPAVPQSAAVVFRRYSTVGQGAGAGPAAGPEPPSWQNTAEFQMNFRTKPQARETKTALGFRKFVDVSACAKGKVKQNITADPAHCGEDSFFISDSYVHTIGVADGVGGWRDMGIDPGQIARQLMHNSKEISEGKYILPHWLLAEAYWKIKYGKEVGAGSTTACIVCLRDYVVRGDDNQQLHKQILYSANLGDSGWVLVRDGRIAETSDSQRVQHNTPKQLAMIPDTLRSDGYIENEPYDASISHHDVQSGDVLVLGTDGLWDNLDMPQVEQMVRDHPADRGIAELSRALVERCIFRPRKPDDVTIVVARV
eukprot:TRINITY_DN23189_c0_g1_i1.p1 TRINITY_DN23189_c0_g1~~TRINITY_DN23189_c0_g1_i1.p1  ORF type:complete len:367 (+),score=74.90 TRINITY_DN23189_c0_g1_i1:93-1103(+)